MVLHLSSEMYKVFLLKITMLEDTILSPVTGEKHANLDLKVTYFHL